MYLQRIHIKNFRAISDITVEVGQHMVMVGANGVGKSCILKAVDKFFAKSPSVTTEDFHNKNTTDPIEITLTFSGFTHEEQEEFSSRIHGGSMVVSRMLTAGAAAREAGKYFGQTPCHLPFQDIRAIAGALPRREAYNAIRQQEKYNELSNAANEGQVFAGLTVWEASHPEECELSLDDGQFLGFTNVGRGKLQKYISFVFVPAIRDAAADALDKGNSVVSQLIELVVKTVVEKRDDFKQWRERTTQEYQNLVNPEKMGELGGLSGILTETLQSFYADTDVDLAWQAAGDFQVSLPAANVALTEQGYTGPVEGKGHGLQRAFIFTILQHLANAVRANPVAEAEDAEANAEIEETSHSLILAIEEPELYQHPTKQRHLAQVLWDISAGRIAGVMGQTQVLLCSHSPHFLSTKRFSEVRLARRGTTDASGNCCRISQVTNQQVCDLLNDGLKLSADKGFKEESLVARLHILDPLVAEGFFADVAVLVEGAGDRAALSAVAIARDLSFEARGIALLAVNGKMNIARPLAVFSLLEIPTYAVFDSDSGLKETDRHPAVNVGIQALSGEVAPQEFRTHVSSRFASFDNCLEDILEAELGDEFPKQIEAARYKYGLPKDRLLKSPVSLGEIVRGCMAAGHESKTLNDIVDAIFELA